MTLTLIKNGEKYETELNLGLNLLGHFQILELECGSECGGHGKCGKDKIQILEGASLLSPTTNIEKNHLTPDQIKSNIRLACQAFPNHPSSKIAVKVPE